MEQFQFSGAAAFNIVCSSPEAKYFTIDKDLFASLIDDSKLIKENLTSYLKIKHKAVLERLYEILKTNLDMHKIKIEFNSQLSDTKNNLTDIQINNLDYTINKSTINSEIVQNISYNTKSTIHKYSSSLNLNKLTNSKNIKNKVNYSQDNIDSNDCENLITSYQNLDTNKNEANSIINFKTIKFQNFKLDNKYTLSSTEPKISLNKVSKYQFQKEWDVNTFRIRKEINKKIDKSRLSIDLNTIDISKLSGYNTVNKQINLKTTNINNQHKDNNVNNKEVLKKIYEYEVQSKNVHTKKFPLFVNAQNSNLHTKIYSVKPNLITIGGEDTFYKNLQSNAIFTPLSNNSSSLSMYNNNNNQNTSSNIVNTKSNVINKTNFMFKPQINDANNTAYNHFTEESNNRKNNYSCNFNNNYLTQNYSSFDFINSSSPSNYRKTNKKDIKNNSSSSLSVEVLNKLSYSQLNENKEVNKLLKNISEKNIATLTQSEISALQILKKNNIIKTKFSSTNNKLKFYKRVIN